MYSTMYLCRSCYRSCYRQHQSRPRRQLGLPACPHLPTHGGRYLYWTNLPNLDFRICRPQSQTGFCQIHQSSNGNFGFLRLYWTGLNYFFQHLTSDRSLWTLTVFSCRALGSDACCYSHNFESRQNGYSWSGCISACQSWSHWGYFLGSNFGPIE